MQRQSRKRSVLVAIRGLLLVALAVILDAGGLLAPLESVLYDARVRHCQGNQPPPAASLVHLDIDDNALNDVGHWPWPRPTLARIIDEVARTQPRVLVMDVLFLEPAADDDVLAAAFGRLGCALVPTSLGFDPVPPASRARRLVLPLLIGDPERTEAQCLAAAPALRAADLDGDDRTDSFSQIRQAAFQQRVWRELSAAGGPGRDPTAFGDEVRRRLLPHDDPLVRTVLDRLFDEAYALALRRWSAQRFTLPLAVAGTTPVLPASSEIAPVPVLGDAAAYGGYVDYLADPVSATVRDVPLLARYGDRIVPHMDLVAACAVLGADVRRLRVTGGAVTVPRDHGPDLVLPVSTREAPAVGPVGPFLEVPLFGRPKQWQTMYDVPRHDRPDRHVSLDSVWQVCQTLDRIAANTDHSDRDLTFWIARHDGPEAAVRFESGPRPTPAERRRLIARAIADTSDYIRQLGGGGGGGDPDPAFADELANATRVNRSLRAIADQAGVLDAQLARQRADLRDRLHDRAIFFGGTATSLQDVQPTSLFGSTPGIVVHGAVFNAIVTGRLWRRTSAGLGVALTAGIGLVALAVATRLPPASAFAASALLGGGYLAVDGYLLFAGHGLVVDAAGPAVAVAVVWAGMTLGNLLTEVRDRARITRRLRMAVDPAVVDYFMANPTRERFDGERRELTVGFSDLVGFTTMSDELGERVVPLLAEYVGHMLPVIRKGRRGTLDKQIGDGLCFIFGAPWPDPGHAGHGVRTALEMHAALAAFNRQLAGRGLRPLGMRIGLATGPVVVGDAGPPDAASYTTLGGTTNLAARLEGANKAFDTRTLVTARTVELSGDEFLCRPIANLRVAGKLDCVVVYEPLCVAAEATDRDRDLARRTAAVFDAFRAADFAGCLRAVADMEAAFGPSKFTRLYAARAADPPDVADHCDGRIVLDEK